MTWMPENLPTHLSYSPDLWSTWSHMSFHIHPFESLDFGPESSRVRDHGAASPALRPAESSRDVSGPPERRKPRLLGPRDRPAVAPNL